MQTDTSPISDVEDLDLDPSSRRGPLDRRELLLGGLLLLIALGWAGWQWWQQDSIERNYRIGQQAEREYRWAEARAGYSAAAGYRDATARLDSVTRVINELQDNFVSARWHAQGGDWAAALRAVQAVRRLDPHYGDATSLGAEAERHVYSDALQGAVAMRPQAQPPGLYYRAKDGWIWLQGSDAESSVRSLVSDGVVVYDAPAANPSHSVASPSPPALTSPNPAQGAEQPNGRQLMGRRLMAASLLDNRPAFARLAFDPDPAAYDFYMGTAHGVWAVRNDSNPSPEQSLRRNAALRYNQSFLTGLDYQTLSSPVSSTVHLPGPEWAVLNVDPGHDRLLLADVKTPRGESAAIDVYVSDAVGDNRRLLYSHRGVLGSAQFSADGRYALLSTYSPLGGLSTEQLSLVLLDLQDSAITGPPVPARTIREKVVAAGAPGSAPFPEMRAAFLARGPWAGMILVAAWGSERGTLSVLDPAHPGSPLLSAEIPGGSAGQAWVNGLEDGTEVVVAWQRQLSGVGTRGGDLVVVRLAPGKPVITESFTLDKNSEVVSSVVKGDFLVCTIVSTVSVPDNQSSAEFAIYSLPLSGSSNAQAQPARLYSTAVSTHGNSLLSGLAWRLGSKLLSYSEKGQLHARTYDGAIDVPLDSGVGSFFDFDWISPALLLH